MRRTTTTPFYCQADCRGSTIFFRKIEDMQDFQISTTNRLKKRKISNAFTEHSDEEDDVFSKLGKTKTKPKPMATITRKLAREEEKEDDGVVVVPETGRPGWRPRFIPTALNEESADEVAEDDDENASTEADSNGTAAATANAAADDDDYLTMAVEDLPSTSIHDMTYTDRRRLKARQIEITSRIRPAEEVRREKLERGLDTSLFDAYDENEAEEGGGSSVALAIMKKMGFVPGMALGKNGQSRDSAVPLRPILKYDHHGIGMDTARASFLRAESTLLEEAEYTERTSFIDRKLQEQLERKTLGQLDAAQKMCQELDITADPRLERLLYAGAGKGEAMAIKAANILWRQRVIDAEIAREEQARRKGILDRPPSPPEISGDGDTSPPPGKTQLVEQLAPEDLEDPELDAFNSLAPAERLRVVLEYMREQYCYCFWCGCRYDGKEDLEANCPGLLEEEHE
ncbi:uncharacterized protein V1518DRAFT_422243 [Limtongia smithiae]|uniref:uncharacterized protein n=1 Tax=Limtongia smithiae TaxID=1125753 RepID=UPI0034CEFFF0